MSCKGHGAGAATAAKDPVCGMSVDPEKARSVTHRGQAYYFCCEGCRTKFANDPEYYLAPPEPVAVEGDDRKYVCPMCPGVESIGPASCPSCGMALEPEAPIDTLKTMYACPMHPEVV